MRRFNSIQALRGIASLMVVLVHLHAMDRAFGFNTPGLSLFRWFGFAGVDLFFVISGFIITLTNRNSLGEPSAAPGFLFRRFWRIYPAYWCAFGVSAGVAALVFGRQILLSSRPEDLAACLALLPGWDNHFVGQAWTLSYELIFYCAFGLLMLMPRNRGKLVLGGWAFAVMAGACYGDLRGSRWMPLQPFVLEFLGGCGIAWLSARGRVRNGPLAIALGLVWAAISITSVNRFESQPYELAMASNRLRVLTFGPSAVLVVYGIVAMEGRWSVPRVLLQSGEASYSLYLTHPPAILIGTYVGYFVPHTNVPHLLWLTGTLAAAIALGLGFHFAVERPLLASIRWRPRLHAARLWIRLSLPRLGARKIPSSHSE